jgi:cytochrome c-type biogenesis protein CcsB
MTVELGSTLFKIAFWIYIGATAAYVVHLLSRRESAGRAGTALLLVGLAFHTASLVVRTIAAERPPFLNLYEYMLSFAWGGIVVYLGLELLTRTRAYGSFAVPLVTGIALLAVRLPIGVNPTMPALESPWRVPHIATAILAYASFAVAVGLAVMYLMREKCEGKDCFWTRRVPSARLLDQTTYRLISFGFMMQTLLLITGAIWAQKAWGKYWSWDPKETWALITWLIYAAYLHMRSAKGWSGRTSAAMVIVGFVAVIFTLFGVNLLDKLGLLGASLHTYAN